MPSACMVVNAAPKPPALATRSMNCLRVVMRRIRALERDIRSPPCNPFSKPRSRTTPDQRSRGTGMPAVPCRGLAETMPLRGAGTIWQANGPMLHRGGFCAHLACRYRSCRADNPALLTGWPQPAYRQTGHGFPLPITDKWHDLPKNSASLTVDRQGVARQGIVLRQEDM
jgi:hypothetical protein